jgi:hypothetical protein
MPVNPQSSSPLAERLSALRASYQEKSLRLMNASVSDPALSDLLGEWPTLYPPWSGRLDEYDCNRFGPLLAVSDEGSAGPAVVDAALGSAKARALGVTDVLDLGVMLDGERMTSAGEAPIGPDEYQSLISAAFGRTLCSTNVGVRVNSRVYRLFPEFDLPAAAIDDSWLKQIASAFQPFIKTPDGKPRPMVVRIKIRPGTSSETMASLMQRLEETRKSAGLATAPVHRFALLLIFDHEIGTQEDISSIRSAIAAAAAAGFPEVVLDGEPLLGARERVMLPSLLNILDLTSLKSLVDFSRNSGVQLSYRYQLDSDTAARTVWTGLQATRSYGFTAGKYGLVPLTLEEQKHVVSCISRWMTGWTAIPAFYADTDLVTKDDVYDEPRRIEAAFLWMKAVREAGAKLVLIDCPDRVTPRHLVRDPNVKDDKGVWTIDQIVEVDRHATKLGLRALWSGGITARQAFALASNRVLGIFSTSATARHIAVQDNLGQDPQLAQEGEPTEEGVRRVHAAIQCGFLSSALTGHDAALADRVKTSGLNLLSAIDTGTNVAEALTSADSALVEAWKAHWKNLERCVPANAVRVWRGRRHSDLDQKSFFGKLGSIFIPFTVQMQRLYGLSAYLPAVLPADRADVLPDEIALVFYNTQQAYSDAKERPGGRAYSDLHALLFDLNASGSGFPKLLEAALELNQPFHLFDKNVDWQKGVAQVVAATRKKDVAVDRYKAAVEAVARSVQSSSESVDGAVLFASEDWLLYWQHSPGPSPLPSFAEVADTGYQQTAQVTQLQSDLRVPYAGLSVSGGEFFNMQFSLR